MDAAFAKSPVRKFENVFKFTRYVDFFIFNSLIQPIFEWKSATNI